MLSTIINNPIIGILLIPSILIALTVHELAHGYVAYKCGDDTAKMMGRLTLNPIKHMDLIGTLMLFVVGFGWAKPVPVNTRNLRKPRRDIALVSVAGAVANLIMAFFGVFLFFVVDKFLYGVIPDNFFETILDFFGYFVMINTGLAVFNLLPIPPLDGSKVLATILPHNIAARYLQAEYYIRYIIMGLFIASYVIPQVSDIIFFPIIYFRDSIISGFVWVMELIF